MQCGCKYTPEPKERGYSNEVRLQAVRLYVDGMNLRRVGRHLGVSPQSVANWVTAYAAQLPPAPTPDEVETMELDELHTFIEKKKTKPTS
jgi:transposase-like protein